MRPIKFGKYNLLERISHGGMAEVFRAKTFGAAGFERTVAIKLLLPTVAMDREFITMLIDEAKIAGQLSHANIAQIFDLGMAEGRYYIVQEFVNGKDLRAILRNLGASDEQLTIAQCCHVLLKVCEGLEYAHNKRDANGRALNLVHRDVSPQNIVLSREGEVKLIDFGIAKAEGRATRTLAGLVKGKFAYMSPEQIRGLPVDRRSDVFACGIVLWELLTGKPLFRRKSEFETLKRARSAEIEPPSQFNSEIPEPLDRIVLTALARHVEDRYQTAIQLRDALWEFVRSHGQFYSRNELAAWMRQRFGKGDDDKAQGSNPDYSIDIQLGQGGEDEFDEGQTVVDAGLGGAGDEAPADDDWGSVSDLARGPNPDRLERVAGVSGSGRLSSSPDLAVIKDEPPQETVVSAPARGTTGVSPPPRGPEDDETQPPLDADEEPTNRPHRRRRPLDRADSAAPTNDFPAATAPYLARGDRLAAAIESAQVESASVPQAGPAPSVAPPPGPAMQAPQPPPGPPLPAMPPPQPAAAPGVAPMAHGPAGSGSVPSQRLAGPAPSAHGSDKIPPQVPDTYKIAKQKLAPTAAPRGRSRWSSVLLAGAVFILLVAGATSITLAVTDASGGGSSSDQAEPSDSR